MITIIGKTVYIKTPFAENYRAKAISNIQFDRKHKCWSAPLLRGTATEILEQFSEQEIGAKNVAILASAMPPPPKDSTFPNHDFKVPPMKHQMRALNSCWGKHNFAFFMRMRTGKTYTSLMWAERLFWTGSIDSLLVVCPTSVKDVWWEEANKFLKIRHDVFVMRAGLNTKAKRFIFDNPAPGTMKIMVFGLESMSQGKAWEFASLFAENYKTMVIVDESQGIKGTSKRTEKITKIGAKCQYRTILTGTPITQGIEDLYSQFNFLDPNIIGMKSYYAFRNRYCTLKTFTAARGTEDEREFTKIVGYKNVIELMSLLDPYSIVVKTEEAFPNLPDRIDKKLIVDPTREQMKAFNALKDTLRAEQGDHEIEIETALERMLRYQQIAGGHFPYDAGSVQLPNGEWRKGYAVKPIEGKNPKLEAMMELIGQDADDQKYIIWSTMVPEIELISARLEAEYGQQAVVRFFGGSSAEERTEARHRFQTDPTCRFFVSNQSVGGVGIKLSAADCMIYYSNSFKYMDREQSGERWIDHERVKHMLVVDIILNHKVDKTIHFALSRKEDVAKYVQGALS